MSMAIALFPFSGMGHLISMVELGKLILTQHPSFSITIFLSPPPTITLISTSHLISSFTSQYIKSVADTNPSISFHHLPPVKPPSPNLDFLELSFQPTRLNTPHIHQALSQTPNHKAVILDIFCDVAYGVAKDLNVSVFYFYTSAACSLAVLLHVPTIHRTIDDLNDLDNNARISVPGLPPISVTAMPSMLFDRTTILYKSFLDIATHMAQSDGLIVNTFDLLEVTAVKAMRDGPAPPVFCLGPLINSSVEKNNCEEGGAQCLRWLEKQPRKSFVFLCFGSMGVFSEEQLKEVAFGLEKSGHRFLWVVRNPPQQLEGDMLLSLPEGFLERTEDRGLVVREWAPQVEVLNHESVGGFVSHCGWNSVLEAVCAGVPMVGWPLYAEQKLTCAFMVEEMKVALAVEFENGGFVSRGELEKRVRELMDESDESESVRVVRERILGFKNGAVAAKKEDGGSSMAALAKLAELWKHQT